jgi:glutamate 5-kinase
MSTKIVAARLATSAGVTTVITRSSNPGNIVKIVKHIQASRSPASLATQANAEDQTPSGGASTAGEHDPMSASIISLTDLAIIVPLHTRFLPSPHPVRDRYFWILHGLRPHGTIYIDAGAHKALIGRAGLLPVGVVDVEGSFSQQEAVRICVVEKKRSEPGEDGKLWEGEATEVGRALVNYASFEIKMIKGHQSSEVKGLIGYADSEYIAQRESISLFSRESRPATPSREAMPEVEVEGSADEGEGAGAAL